MNPETERHIRIIYGDSLSNDLINRLIHHFDSFLDRFQNSVSPHTESEKTGYILEWIGTQYFSVVHSTRSKPVVLAGAIDKRDNIRFVAAIRFFDDNPSLQNVPPQYLFPYRKPHWTNVELAKETIDRLPELFNSQVRLYNQRYISQERDHSL